MINIPKPAGLIALVFVLTGCNMGMAPSGGTTAEIEARFKQLDPKEQIRIIQGSPAPPGRKAQLIKDIEDKYGIKSGDSPVLGGSQSNPAPPPPAGETH